MRKPRFEVLALVIGVISILVVVALTGWSTSLDAEIAAQGLLLLVLLGALYHGRDGGTMMAVFASVVYFSMRIPLIVRTGFTEDVLVLLGGRTLSYFALGVGGGILCGRIHYILERFEGAPNLDPHTKLFNQRFIGANMRSLVAQHVRYSSPFSVVIFAVPGLLGAKPAPDRVRQLRAVAELLRDGVRLIDQVARFDDGRFVLVLPHTAKAGAEIAARRNHAALERLLQGKDDVSVEVLGAEEDLPAIQDLCDYPAAADEGNSRATDGHSRETDRVA